MAFFQFIKETHIIDIHLKPITFHLMYIAVLYDPTIIRFANKQLVTFFKFYNKLQILMSALCTEH